MNYMNKSKHLITNQIENIQLPKLLSPLHNEFKPYHYMLLYLHPKYMLFLEQLRVLTKHFI